MTALADLTVAELESTLARWGLNPAHAERVLRSVYKSGGRLDAGSRALPKGVLERLLGEYPAAAELAGRRTAEDGTTKLLLRLADGRTVEAVLMPDFRDDRAAACLSSQAGCALGCDFCATAMGGFDRNLTAGEIVEQFFALRREAAAGGRRLRTVVFMGMGEPLLNLDAVLAASRRLADNALGGLGSRQIMISTVGIVPAMDALTGAGLPVKLAVSLHAPDDEGRARLLPMARRFTIAETLTAADRFQARHKQVVTIQYCLLKGVNDSPGHARALAALLAGRRMHVNLLRYSPTGPGLSGVEYAPSGEAAEKAFLEELTSRGVVAHPRRPRGPDIDAACGQLRRSGPPLRRRCGALD